MANDSEKRILKFLLFSAIVQETESTLKDYQSKQQILHEYLQDALSYTNVTEESIMEVIIKGKTYNAFILIKVLLSFKQ